MPTKTISDRARTILRELETLMGAIDEAALGLLVEEMLAAGKIVFTAQGRSGLMLKAIAVRLMHIGLPVFVAGESVTPSVAKGDLTIAVSSSARTATTLIHLAAARKAGGRTVLFTCAGEADALADLVIRLPVRGEIATVQHAGSLFEQGMLVIGDAVAFAIQSRLGVSEAVMNDRHATLQ